MNTQTILPHGPLNAAVVPPGSKSITNRALILAAMSEGQTILDGALDSEDTQVMFNALRQLGLEVLHDPAVNQMSVIGKHGIFSNKHAEIYVGNSGTTARFLTAMLAFSDGNYRIYGKPRMHERPIDDLAESLKELGAEIRYEEKVGFPPLLIHGVSGKLHRRGAKLTTISGSVSSQFLSALLMSAPLSAGTEQTEIHVSNGLVSKPYVEMTLAMMESFGVQTSVSGDFEIFRFMPGTIYRTPKNYRIEPDASAASYFFAAAAVCGGTVKIPGLSQQSLQGDIEFVNCLERMGCFVKWNSDSISVNRSLEKPLRGISVDMNSFSDTVQTLAAVALFADGPTEITNIEHVRFKETDRITDLAVELRRFGAKVDERQDGLTIIPPQKLVPATVETYDDHRMAMSFAVVGLRLPGVIINNPECTRKTFPDFFNVLANLK